MRYDFTLIMREGPELTEEVAEALYEAGCDDGTPGTGDGTPGTGDGTPGTGDGTPGTGEGVFTIDFHREADSLEAAIKSAISDLTAAGYSVSRVEMDAAAEALCT